MIFDVDECEIIQISCSKKSFTPFYIWKRQFPEEILYSIYLGINRTCAYASSNHIVFVAKKCHLTLGFIQCSLRSCPRRYKETAYINLVSSAWNTRQPSVPLKYTNNNDNNDFIGASIYFHVIFYVALFSNVSNFAQVSIQDCFMAQYTLIVYHLPSNYSRSRPGNHKKPLSNSSLLCRASNMIFWFMMPTPAISVGVCVYVCTTLTNMCVYIYKYIYIYIYIYIYMYIFISTCLSWYLHPLIHWWVVCNHWEVINSLRPGDGDTDPSHHWLR